MSTMPEQTETAAPSPSPNVPRPAIRWLAVILCALGWWLSNDLFRMGQQAQPSPLLASLCSADQDSGCSGVLASEWSSIRLSRSGTARMPVSLLGMAYFAFVGVWFLFVGCPTFSRRPWHILVTVVVVFAAFLSLQYVGLMATVLKQWCTGCLVVHVINGVLLLLTLMAFPWRTEATPYEHHPRGRLAIATFMAAGSLYVLHIFFGLLVIQSQSMQRLTDAYKKITQDVAYIQWNHERQPLVEVPPRDQPMWFGDEDAPNTLIAFLDFGCPKCREADAEVRKAIERLPGRMRVEYRHFPLDQSCNPDIKRNLHPGACEAAFQAEAAAALGDKDAFLALKPKLYRQGGPLPEAEINKWAAEQGWETATWTAALERAKQQVAADIAAREATGSTNVPALYLNGRRLSNWTEQAWDALLAEE